MDEHGRKFVDGLVIVLPDILELLLHVGGARAQ